MWHCPPYSICGGAGAAEGGGSVRELSREFHSAGQAAGHGGAEWQRDMAARCGKAPPRLAAAWQGISLTLCILTKGLGPRQVLHTMGKSLRSQPSASCGGQQQRGGQCGVQARQISQGQRPGTPCRRRSGDGAPLACRGGAEEGQLTGSWVLSRAAMVRRPWLQQRLRGTMLVLAASLRGRLSAATQRTGAELGWDWREVALRSFAQQSLHRPAPTCWRPAGGSARQRAAGME
jgi:hypothetical protein